MEGAIIGYVRISDDTMAQSHRGNLDPIWAPNLFLFLLNFTRTLWFFWDLALTLFDIAKEAVFAEILVLCKFLVFQK